MNIKYEQSFLKDIQKIKDKKIKKRIEEVIQQVKDATKLEEIKELLKIKGAKNYFRIKIRTYRIGVYKEENTIIFVRCIQRKDFYKFFP